MYGVVKFLSQVVFVFVLFLGMLKYANEVETKKKIKITWDKKMKYNMYINNTPLRTYIAANRS